MGRLEDQQEYVRKLLAHVRMGNLNHFGRHNINPFLPESRYSKNEETTGISVNLHFFGAPNVNFKLFKRKAETISHRQFIKGLMTPDSHFMPLAMSAELWSEEICPVRVSPITPNDSKSNWISSLLHGLGSLCWVS
jgi:hypothetical protein